MKRLGALKGSGKKGYYNFLANDPKIHSDSAMGQKQPQAISPIATRVPSAIKKADAMWAFAKNPYLTEIEINRVKNRMNRGQMLNIQFWQMRDGLPIGITPEQTTKGLDWLKNLWETPEGKLRKRNPFNNSQIYVLDHFSNFTIVEFEDVATSFQQQHNIHSYLPHYRVTARDGSYFIYRLDNSADPPIKIIETQIQPEP